MLSRPLGAILAVVVGAAVASAQPAPFPDSPPPAAFVPDEGAGVGVGEIPVNLGTGPDPYRWWLSGEYLLGFTREANAPTVASAGPAATGGIIGLAGTRQLTSAMPDFGSISGARLSGGVWLEDCRAYGLDWSVFFLGRRQADSTFNAGTGEVLARPFFDTAFNVENSRRISLPGVVSGSVTTNYRTDFWGGELGTRLRVIETPTLSVEQLFHFRYYQLDETFTASDTSTALAGGVVAFNGQAFPAPARVRVTDQYAVTNRFYGGSAGARLLWTPGRWEVRVDGRMGIGAVEQNVTLSGSTSLENAGPTATVPGGFYTNAVNTGVFRSYRLSLAPDVTARVGYRVTDWLMLTAGYQFLYMTNVTRPGDMIVRQLNSARIPSSQNFGAAAPGVAIEPTFISRDFWMHGLTAGLMLTF